VKLINVEGRFIMLFMKDIELAARLQHSSNIDELMEGINDRPEPAARRSSGSGLASISTASMPDDNAHPVDHKNAREKAPKALYPRAA